MRRSLHLLAATSITLVMGAAAEAQFGIGGGNTVNFQLNRIANQSVGNQFTGSAINRQILSQSYAQAPVTGTPLVTGNVTRPSLFGGSGRAQRPFSNIDRKPTVSPYLQLFNSDNSFDPNFATDYQTLVRPQLEQRQFNNQVRREAAQINAQLQSIAAQPAFRPTGNQNLAPTGIGASVYRYHSHFYPQMR